MDSTNDSDPAPSRAVPVVGIYVLSLFWLVHFCLIPYVVFLAWLFKELSGGLFVSNPQDPVVVM